MKKALITFGLLVIIILTLGLIVLQLSANGSEDNFFNKNYRAGFAQYPILRKMIGLDFDGDGKQDYLGKRYDKILVEVDRMQGLVIPSATKSLLKRKIEDVTGKEVLLIDDDEIPYQETVSMQNISQIVKQYRNINFVKNSAKIYILYLSQQGHEIDHLGSTYQEYGILVFHTALENVTRGNPEILDNYIESTALHEFGHQLGLSHNNVPNCLMSELVESSRVYREDPEDVVVDFCDYEKDLIKQLK